jgi:hypothetical protein
MGVTPTAVVVSFAVMSWLSVAAAGALGIAEVSRNESADANVRELGRIAWTPTLLAD